MYDVYHRSLDFIDSLKHLVVEFIACRVSDNLHTCELFIFATFLASDCLYFELRVGFKAYVHAMNLSVMSGATPAFSANRDVHCASGSIFSIF